MMPDTLTHRHTDTAVRPAPFAPRDYAVSGIYLNAASRHPLPQPVVARVRDYADLLGTCPIAQGLSDKQARVRTQFATLIGADADEIALVPSTVLAENLLIASLGLRNGPRGIVTDALHYAGSLRLYDQLARDGVPVTVLPVVAGGIDYDQLADTLKRDVALVAMSSVSHRNGFTHDLTAVCALAHATGALVYADIIQHAGALPLDVRASGVDFCACSTYKWLLGDMGLGFLYARRGRWPALSPCIGGGPVRSDALPPRASRPSDLFHVGTLSAAGVEALMGSLPHTIAFMADDPDAVWRPLLAHIDRRFDALGLAPTSPAGGRAPIRAFIDARITPRLIKALACHGIRVGGGNGYLRLSPSVFNTTAHIDEAADAIACSLRMDDGII